MAKQTKKQSESVVEASQGRCFVRVLRDGVFVDNGVRADNGDECECHPDVAEILIERGDAKRI
jgi:hypothetical protein